MTKILPKASDFIVADGDCADCYFTLVFESCNPSAPKLTEAQQDLILEVQQQFRYACGNETNVCYKLSPKSNY
jgi:hypothetical protein